MGYMKYLKLMNRMNAVTQVPQPPVPQFEKYCKLFVTDEEYDIMMGMKLRGNTEAELRALYTGSDWAGTLYDMCRKGFLLKIYDGAEPTYDLAPMLPGWFEFPLSTGEDSDTIQKASELFTSAINMVTTLNVEPLRTGYAAMNNLKKLQGDKGHMEVALPLEGKAAGKVVHVDRKLSNDTTSVVPSYQLEAYLDSLPDDAPISVMHCFCRNIRRREGMQPKHPTPDEVCLCVGNMAKQIIEFGIGCQVSKAEARQILVDCEKKGCVHQVFHYACNMDEETTAICNCDTQCCEMLGSYTRGGMQPLYMRAHAKPVIVHPENCNGCNICNHFCPTWPPASTRRAARCSWSISAASAAACASRSARRTYARWSTATACSSASRSRRTWCASAMSAASRKRNKCTRQPLPRRSLTSPSRRWRKTASRA